MKNLFKNLFEIIILLVGLFFWLGIAMTCNGQVLYEAKKYDADVVVYITDNKYESDRIVYYTKNKSEANSYGIVYWSSKRWEADTKIYITDKKYLADEIWYVTKHKWQTNDEDKTWIGGDGKKFQD